VETALSLQVLEPLMLLLEPLAVFCEFNQQIRCMYMCLVTFMHVIGVCLPDVVAFMNYNFLTLNPVVQDWRYPYQCVL
jgi:hypothetical protein